MLGAIILFTSLVGIYGQQCPHQTAILFGGHVRGNRYSCKVEKLGDCDFATNDMAFNSRNVRGAVFGDKIYLCGGHDADSDLTQCSIREKNGTQNDGPSMNQARTLHTLNVVGSKLVAVGGRIGGQTFLDSVEVLDPASGAGWVTQSYKINPERERHCAVTISSNSVMLVGGSNSMEGLGRAEELNIDTGAVTAYPDLPNSIGTNDCTLYRNMIMVAGGFYGDEGRTNKVFFLDFSSTGAVWIEGPSMIRARNSHSLAVINGVPTVYSGYGDGFGSMEEFKDDEWVETEGISEKYGYGVVVISCSVSC